MLSRPIAFCTILLNGKLVGFRKLKFGMTVKSRVISNILRAIANIGFRNFLDESLKTVAQLKDEQSTRTVVGIITCGAASVKSLRGTALLRSLRRSNALPL
jgi:hypothetical protein